MTIKNRLNKLERLTPPSDDKLIGIYYKHSDYVMCNGNRLSAEAWELVKKPTDTEVTIVMIPDNGRS